MDAGAIVLWPEEEDLYTLMCMRAEGGRTAFEREKQNSPFNPELCEWPESYFDEKVWFDEWPNGVAGEDAGLGPEQGERFAAGRLLGAGDAGGRSAGDCSTSRPIWPAGRRRRWWPKASSFSAAFAPTCSASRRTNSKTCWRASSRREFRRQGMLAARPWPIENRVNKQVRIRRLGPYLSARRLRFKSNSPGTRLLVEQLEQFPIGDHDDGPDAAEMAIRLAGELLEGRRRRDGLGNRIPVG